MCLKLQTTSRTLVIVVGRRETVEARIAALETALWHISEADSMEVAERNIRNKHDGLMEEIGRVPDFEGECERCGRVRCSESCEFCVDCCGIVQHRCGRENAETAVDDSLTLPGADESESCEEREVLESGRRPGNGADRSAQTGGREASSGQSAAAAQSDLAKTVVAVGDRVFVIREDGETVDITDDKKAWWDVMKDNWPDPDNGRAWVAGYGNAIHDVRDLLDDIEDGLLEDIGEANSRAKDPDDEYPFEARKMAVREANNKRDVLDEVRRRLDAVAGADEARNTEEGGTE